MAESVSSSLRANDDKWVPKSWVRLYGELNLGSKAVFWASKDSW